MRAKLTDIDRAKIAQAVAEAEAMTGVEIKLVLAHASSHYQAAALVYPALLALVVGGLAAAVRPTMHAHTLFTVEVLFLLATAAVLQWTPLRLALVPPSIKRAATWQFARVHYADIGLTRPHAKGALLIFCSAAERSVEILADDAIAEKLPAGIWQPIVDGFRADFSHGRTAAAFIAAVKACAEVLAPVFPPGPGQANEIPDDLIEL